MIERNHQVSRITNNVNDLAVSRIKRFMAFQNSGSGIAAKYAIWEQINVRNARVDV